MIIIWYSTVTDIGPHRRYYIKTQSGHILVRNCIVVSQHWFPTHRTNNLHKANQPLYRRSCHQRNRPTRRVIEDPTWLGAFVSIPSTKAWWRGVGNWLAVFSLYDVINLIWWLYHVSCHVIVCKSSFWHDLGVFSTTTSIKITSMSKYNTESG